MTGSPSAGAERSGASPLKLALLPAPPFEEDVAEHLAPPPVELHFGVALRRAREQRGFSARDIAQKTRISVRWIEALEEARLNELPAEVFVSGYLRSYARAVGLDGQALLGRYHALLRERGGESALADRGTRGSLSRRSAQWKNKHAVLWLLLVGFATLVVLTLLAVAWRRGALHL